LSPEDAGKEAFERGRHDRGVTELAVELTMAWLKRVESTADGRDPKEVVAAMSEFFEAIHHHQQEETRAKQREPVGAR
jgi:hypothetical protein